MSVSRMKYVNLGKSGLKVGGVTSCSGIRRSGRTERC